MNQTAAGHDAPLINDELWSLMRAIKHGFICQIIDVFGSATNVVNMIVFAKLGLSETINASLFALAFSDFGACFTLIWLNICTLPWFKDLDLPFDPNQIQFLISSWPHVLFTRVTALLTGIIMAERCLCVMLPLKIRSIVTRGRVTNLIVGSYLLVIVSAIPVYYSTRYAWKFYVKFNKSLIGLVFTDNKGEIEAVYGPLQNTLFAILPFIFICTSTAILVGALKKKADWREKATAEQSMESSKKDNKVSKMLVVVSTLFICCYFPNVVVNTLMLSHEDFAIDGKEKNLITTLGTVSFVLESINSSVNIFIYYKYNTNYRLMFLKVFKFT